MVALGWVDDQISTYEIPSA